MIALSCIACMYHLIHKLHPVHIGRRIKWYSFWKCHYTGGDLQYTISLQVLFLGILLPCLLLVFSHKAYELKANIREALNFG